MDKQNIWILSELFYPEQTSTSYIMTKLANKLVNKYIVNVICASPVYDLNMQPSSNSKISDDILVHRIGGIRGNKNRILFRLIRSIDITVKMNRYLCNNVSSLDNVLIVTNPIFLVILIARLKQEKHFRFGIMVHDVFPENIVPTHLISKNGIIYKLLKFIFDRSYAKADYILACGSDMKNVLEQKIQKYNSLAKIDVVHNWAEIKEINPSQLQLNSVQDSITIQFAGNIGRVQGLLDVLKIIELVKNPILNFTFHGDGALKKEMMSYATRNNIKNVSFFNGFLRSDQNAILNKCTLGLVCLDDSMYGLGVPSKTYNIMAAGKPILFLGNLGSEISLLVKENHIGFSFSLSDTARILNYLNGLTLEDIPKLNKMGIEARKISENEYSEEAILNRFATII